jgi:hypothetical protein
MSFSMPKAPVRGHRGWSKGGAAPGRVQWSAGQKLWNTAVLSGNFSKAVVSNPTSDTDAEYTSAFLDALKDPSAWLSPEALLPKVTASTSQLVNRPGVGLSELGSAITSYETLLREGASKGVLSRSFTKKWLERMEALDIARAAELLNSQDYPEMNRSEAELRTATVHILQFANVLRENWDEVVWFFGLATTMSVSGAWLLQLASLSVPGAWAAALRDVPNLPPSKDKLVAQPTKGKVLAEFLAECVSSLAASREPRRAAIKRTSDMLTFSDTEDELEQPRVRKVPPKMKKDLVKASEAFLSYEGPVNEAKVLAKRVQKLYNEVMELDASVAQNLCDCNAVKAHLQKIKAEASAEM